MKRTTLEMSVGVFVLVGILAISYLAIRLGKMELLGDDYYTLQARFTTVGGLKTGAPVELAGVEVGQVVSIELDLKKMAALVTLKVKDKVKLPEDTIASVRTSGLIGDKFIKLTPGGEEAILKPGGMITDTEPSVNLEELIGKYVFGSV